MALRKDWKAFENILPEFLTVIMLVGIILAILNPQTVLLLIGERSGWFGVVGAAIVGAITLIPGFVAFPLASMLLDKGLGIRYWGLGKDIRSPSCLTYTILIPIG